MMVKMHLALKSRQGSEEFNQKLLNKITDLQAEIKQNEKNHHRDQKELDRLRRLYAEKHNDNLDLKIIITNLEKDIKISVDD